MPVAPKAVKNYPHKRQQQTLTSEQNYKQAFQGQKLYLPSFLVVFCPNNLKYPRLGLAVAKKHYKAAVARNLIKRIIRENFRTYILPAVDVVFISRASLSLDNRKIINQIIIQLLNKINRGF